MGLRTGAYLTVWEVNDKGKYADCRCTCSKKNKQTGNYEQDWNGFIRFIGQAHDVAIALTGERPRIKVGEFEVTNNYSKEKNTTYTNYAMFTCENADGQPTQAPGESSSQPDFMSIPDSIEEELPFR